MKPFVEKNVLLQILAIPELHSHFNVVYNSLRVALVVIF